MWLRPEQAENKWSNNLVLDVGSELADCNPPGDSFRSSMKLNYTEICITNISWSSHIILKMQTTFIFSLSIVVGKWVLNYFLSLNLVCSLKRVLLYCSLLLLQICVFFWCLNSLWPSLFHQSRAVKLGLLSHDQLKQKHFVALWTN